MKKIYICMLAAAASAFVSCSKDFEDIGVAPESGRLVLFAEHPTSRTESGSRVAISGDNAVWETGDMIGVFADASTEAECFTLTTGAGTVSAGFEGNVGIEEGDKVYVIAPYVADTVKTTPSKVKISFNGQTQNGFGTHAEEHLGKYAYMAAAPATVADGRADLQFEYLAVKMSFEFSLPEDATVKFLTLSTKQNILYDKGCVDLTADAPQAKPWGTASRTLSMGFENGAVQAGQTVTAHMMMMPANLSSAAVTFYISAEKSDGTPVTYTMTKSSGLNFAASTSYTAEIKSLAAYNTYIPMVYVPGGSLNICGMYVEGLDEYQLLEKDYKVNSFWMSQTEVTNQQYCDFLNSRKPMDIQLNAWIDSEVTQIEVVGGKYVPKSGPILQADKTKKTGSYADYPVICVTYNGANAYSAWVAEKMCGYSESNYTVGCYLPSEAQWEYAATGSEWNVEWNELLLAGGNDPDKVMWYCGNCDSEGSCCLGAYMGNAGDPDAVSGSGSLTGGTHPVGKLQPNYLGLYDMSGNVGEICADYFVYEKFPYGSSLDPRCMDINAASTYDGEQLRSVRGGFWFGGALNGVTFMRDYVYLTYSSNMTGFRVILPLK